MQRRAARFADMQAAAAVLSLTGEHGFRSVNEASPRRPIPDDSQRRQEGNVDAIHLPNGISLPTTFGAPGMPLQAGQVVQALVLELIESDVFRLQLPQAMVDVRSDVPLTPGSTITLAVKGGGATRNSHLFGCAGEWAGRCTPVSPGACRSAKPLRSRGPGAGQGCSTAGALRCAAPCCAGAGRQRGRAVRRGATVRVGAALRRPGTGDSEVGHDVRGCAGRCSCRCG